MNLKERAKKLKSDVPAIFLALKDKRTPWIAKIVAGNLWKDGKPKRWYYAIPILLIWVALVGLIIWCIIK